MTKPRGDGHTKLGIYDKKKKKGLEPLIKILNTV